MPTIDNPALYEKAKKIIYKKYDKPSAYRSGALVRLYKEMGGTYTDDGKPKNIKRWFAENWTDVAGLDYPVYRPTKRITPETPLLPHEIDFNNLVKQSLLKQEIRGSRNLPPFLEK